MALIAEDYQNQYTFSFESQILGRIRVWAAKSLKAQRSLRYRLPSREKESARDYMLFLLSVTAAPENPDNPRHQEATLSVEQLSHLSDNELEEIAGLFLMHHKYLFEDPGRYSCQDAGSGMVEIKNESLDFPRTEGESNVTYLKRLVENYCYLQTEATQKAMAGISETLSKVSVPDFSALTEMNSHMSDSLNEAMDAMRASYRVGQEMASFAPGLVALPTPQQTTNNILGDIASVLFQQKDINVEMTRHIQQLPHWRRSGRHLPRSPLV